MRKFVSGLLLFAVYTSIFSPFILPVNAQNIRQARENKMKDTPAGLKFRLSEGTEGAETRVKQPMAQTEPLPDGDVSGVLKRQRED